MNTQDLYTRELMASYGMRRRTRTRSRFFFPLGHVFLFLVLVMTMKLSMYLVMGGAAYGAHYNQLMSGTPFEQFVGQVLWIDPLMQALINMARLVGI